MNTEKVEVLNAFFASFLIGKISCQEFQAPKTSKEIWSKEDLPSVKEDKIRECLNQMDIQKVKRFLLRKSCPKSKFTPSLQIFRTSLNLELSKLLKLTQL